MEAMARIADEEIQQGAKRLVQELRTGEFPMDRLLNSSNIFNGRLEHEDYLRYIRRIEGRMFSYILPE